MQHLRLAGDAADMQVRNKQDFGAGVMFALIGAFACLGALKYDMGTARDMGPGYFPFWLGACLTLLGASIALRSLSTHAPISRLDPADWKTVAILIGSVALAGALLNVLGIFLTVFVLVVLSSMASHLFDWRVAALTGIGLAAFVWLAFIKALGLIFPLWPPMFGQ
ncbi:tripartite tricarboxylate transporter TctB family protein [Pusillimonas caeni]|nr:tripartite tricarboxylate transporter TctB family protein [Pusillimonas caeni]